MNSIFAIMIFALFIASIISTPTDVFGLVDSSRKQMTNGISAEDVICKNELHLMIRNNGDAILCSDQVPKLGSRDDGYFSSM